MFVCSAAKCRARVGHARSLCEDCGKFARETRELMEKDKWAERKRKFDQKAADLKQERRTFEAERRAWEAEKGQWSARMGIREAEVEAERQAFVKSKEGLEEHIDKFFSEMDGPAGD